MKETLHNHQTSIFIGGRPNLPFTDDVWAVAMVNMQDFTSRLVDRARAYEIEGSTEKR